MELQVLVHPTAVGFSQQFKLALLSTSTEYEKASNQVFLPSILV